MSSTPNLAVFAREFSVFDLPYITSPKFQKNLYTSINKNDDTFAPMGFRDKNNKLGRAVLVASMSMQKHSMIFPTLHRLNLLFSNIFLAYQTIA